ncbi:MAG: hypothetical protein ACLTNO_06995 [Blautia sp.]
MKIGKLPEQVLVRSVLRKVAHRREEVLSGPGVGRIARPCNWMRMRFS